MPAIVVPSTPVIAVSVDLLNADGTSTVLAIPATGYVIVSAGLEGQRRRRSTVDSAWVHGTQETASVIGEAQYGLEVLVHGPDGATVAARVQALINASQQTVWRVRETWEGVTTVWAARAADWEAPRARELAWSHARVVTLTIPIHPVSL